LGAPAETTPLKGTNEMGSRKKLDFRQLARFDRSAE
jgi:hypothetical protein